MRTRPCCGCCDRLHRLAGADIPYASLTAAGQRFIAAVQDSPALKARAQAIPDEAEAVLAQAESAGQRPDDGLAYLAASLLMATMAAALLAAHRHVGARQDAQAARAVFLALVDAAAPGWQWRWRQARRHERLHIVRHQAWSAMPVLRLRGG